MQLRVEAARARMRTAVRVITGCTMVTAARPRRAQPHLRRRATRSLTGQVVLALIAGCWGVALWWLAAMSRFQTPERFLLAADAREAAR